MNKYQKYFVENVLSFHIWDGKKSGMTKCKVEDYSIVLNQYDDITITKYMLLFSMEKIHTQLM